MIIYIGSYNYVFDANNVLVCTILPTTNCDFKATDERAGCPNSVRNYEYVIRMLQSKQSQKNVSQLFVHGAPRGRRIHAMVVAQVVV